MFLEERLWFEGRACFAEPLSGRKARLRSLFVEGGLANQRQTIEPSTTSNPWFLSKRNEFRNKISCDIHFRIC